MLVYVHGAKCVGIEAVPVTVEVDITLGIGIHVVISEIFGNSNFSIFISC